MPFFSKIVKFLTRRDDTQKPTPRKTPSERVVIPSPLSKPLNLSKETRGVENKPKKKSGRGRKKVIDENAELKTAKPIDVKAKKTETPRLQPRRGDSVYPPSLRSAKKKKKAKAPMTTTPTPPAETPPAKGAKQKTSATPPKSVTSESADKTLLEDECGEVLTRDDVNQMIAELTDEQKAPQKCDFDPWADLDGLKERSATIYSKKSARLNTAVAHSRLLDLEFESQREEPTLPSDATIPHVTIAEGVFRRTYSVRDKNKVNDETISLNDESKQHTKEDK